MTTDNSTTPEMIERVARSLALSTHLRLIPANTFDGFRTLVDITWMGFISDARAAIAAMREPTEAMIREGMDANDLLTEDQVLPAYQSMIDAALGE